MGSEIESHIAALAKEAEKLEAAYEWIRHPDWAERFNSSDLAEWMNDRPCGVLQRAAYHARALAALARSTQDEGEAGR